MKFRSYFLSLILSLFCVMQTMAAEIPAEHIGAGKWVTLKTENGYFFYAIEEDGQIKLGQTQAAPNAENYAAYCWQIEGDATNGYTFRCLKYENYADGKKYISNPATLAVNNQEVRLTTTPSYYDYTDNHQLQLRQNSCGLYLAFYSRSYHTIRLHNSPDYVGSKMVIGGINDWSVAAVVYGTETEDGDGHPQGTYLSNGGIRSGTTNYLHGTSLYLDDASLANLTIVPIPGYAHSTIKIDKENHYIVAYYIGEQSGISYKNAGTTKDSETVVTGESGTIWALNAKDYITNTSGHYENVPADKAWQIEVVVQNTNTSGTDPSFNKWGSCILASNGDPLNTYYWGDFQIYQHAPTHSSPNTLNFKSSKADGNDHIIAQGASVANKSYKVLVRYNGSGVYVIRTIMLDETLQETSDVYNNVWVTARPQVAINQMSCAIPTGINLKSLRISIAEESNLLEGMDYAIQNTVGKEYLTGGSNAQGDWYSAYAGDAAKFHIEWTGNNDLTYAESDGGLHNSFYIKVADKYLASNNTLVDEKTSAQAFVFTTNSRIAPITSKNTLGTTWTIGDNNTWLWDFFANFYVEVAGNSSGGLHYQKDNAQQTATNGQYIELPAGVSVNQMSNSSQAGYSAAISKADIRLKVQYSALDNTFYHITAKTPDAQPELYYWNKPQGRLITYSTTNSQSGVVTAWGEKGDCSKFTITRATEIPMKMSQIEGSYYNTVYCPNALTLPEGVKAFRLKDVVDGKFSLSEMTLAGNVLPANTPVVLISESAVTTSNWTISTTPQAAAASANLFCGVFEQTENPDAGKSTSNIFVLGNKKGIGFYPYTAARIPAFKVYYEAPSTSEVKAFSFSFEEDEATAIHGGILGGVLTSGHQDCNSHSQPVIYDLTGRRTTLLQSGHLYIVNGKKVYYEKK